MSNFVTFITREATTALRQVAAAREAVKRPDATAEEAQAFFVACQKAETIRAIMEQSGYADLYDALRDEIDAEA